MWVDPALKAVYIHMSVCLQMAEFNRMKWGFDLFVNAATSAIED